MNQVIPRLFKAEFRRIVRLGMAEALEAQLMRLDTDVFEYPVELKAAGDLRKHIGLALAELRLHQEVARG